MFCPRSCAVCTIVEIHHDAMGEADIVVGRACDAAHVVSHTPVPPPHGTVTPFAWALELLIARKRAINLEASSPSDAISIRRPGNLPLVPDVWLP